MEPTPVLHCQAFINVTPLIDVLLVVCIFMS